MRLWGQLVPSVAAQAKAGPEFTKAGNVNTKPQMRAPGGRQQLYTPGWRGDGHALFHSQTLSIAGPGDQTEIHCPQAFSFHFRRSLRCWPSCT